MKVSELMQILQALPQDHDVYVYAGFDGMCGSGPLIGAGVALSETTGDHVALVDEDALFMLDAEPASVVAS